MESSRLHARTSTKEGGAMRPSHPVILHVSSTDVGLGTTGGSGYRGANTATGVMFTSGRKICSNMPIGWKVGKPIPPNLILRLPAPKISGFDTQWLNELAESKITYCV